MAIDPVTAKLIKRCQKSPAFFLDNFAKIQHPKLGVIPFKLFKYQQKCLSDFLSNRFTIFKKVRQCGISTISGGFALWYAMFFNNKNILIVSKRDDDAMDFLRRNVKVIHDNLPDWMKDLWPRVVDNEHEILFPNGSRIKSLTSSKETLRSQAASLNIIDEAAFIPDMDDMWAAGLPSIQHGGTVIVISTVKGVGNWYWQTWTDAEANQNDFHPIVIDWWDMDWKLEFGDELSGRTISIDPTRGKRECLTKEDKDKYGPYWSPWLEEQYRNLTQKGDSTKFRQEILCAFVGTGDSVLNREALQAITESVDKNYKTIDKVDYVNPYSENRDVLEFQDRLWIWNTPEAGHIYTMGVDTSSGDASDYSTIEVFDINEQEQVAELQIKVLPRVFAKMVDYVGRWYNNAFAVVERSGIGVAICQELSENLGYQNLYRKAKKNAYNKDIKYGDVGFATTTTSKPLLNKSLTDNIGQDGWTIKSMRLQREFLIYVHLKGGRTGAEPGKGNNDDLVIAASLCFIGANQAATNDVTPLIPLRNMDLGPTLRDPGGSVHTLQNIANTNNIMLPVQIIDNSSQPLSIMQELSKFTSQLGSMPMDRTTVNPINPQKHAIRWYKNKK
jgi:phage FluMu gp28-like protein